MALIGGSAEANTGLAGALYVALENEFGPFKEIDQSTLYRFCDALGAAIVGYLFPGPLLHDGQVSQALKGTQTGTTPVIVGSFYGLSTDTILSADSSVWMGADNGIDDAILDIRRSDNGTLVATITKTGLIGSQAPASNIALPYDGFYDLEISASQVGTVAAILGFHFVFEVTNGSRINQALQEQQTGVTPLVVGSVYLPGGTLQASSQVLLGTAGAGTATLELRRAGAGTLVATWTSGVAALPTAISLSGAVVLPGAEYYDLRIFGDAGPTEAILRGINLAVVS